MIAGLEEISSGEIRIKGYTNKWRDIHQSVNIAMVFQTYALYPNMTGGQEYDFWAWKCMESQTRSVRSTMKEVAELLQIDPAAGSQTECNFQAASVNVWRWAEHWFGDPDVFLFDEPLSNLDAKLRVDMRTEIKKLH